MADAQKTIDLIFNGIDRTGATVAVTVTRLLDAMAILDKCVEGAVTNGRAFHDSAFRVLAVRRLA